MPIPASPSTQTKRRLPPTASARHDNTWSNSTSRPTNGKYSEVHAGSGVMNPASAASSVGSWFSTRRSSSPIAVEGANPELVAECLSVRVTNPQRLGLAAGAVERGDLLRPEMLTERLVGEDGLDVGEHFQVPTVDEQRVVARLDQRQPQLAQAARRVSRERQIREIVECVTAPQRERAFECARRVRRFVARERGPAVAQQCLGDEQIGLVGTDVEAVATRLGDHGISERSQPGPQVVKPRLATRRPARRAARLPRAH